MAIRSVSQNGGIRSKGAHGLWTHWIGLFRSADWLNGAINNKSEGCMTIENRIRIQVERLFTKENRKAKRIYIGSADHADLMQEISAITFFKLGPTKADRDTWNGLSIYIVNKDSHLEVV